MVRFTARATYNHVIYIHSTEYNTTEGEIGPVGRVLEDIEPFVRSSELGFTDYYVRNRSQLLEVLASVAQMEIYPLIHFNMHGNEELGLALVDGDFCDWRSLGDALRQINILTCNNLVVVMNACFSLQVARSLAEIDSAAPFYAVLAPERVITEGEIERGSLGFYRTLFTENDLVEAMSCFPSARLLNSEKLFFDAMVEYYIELCSPKAVDQRAEKMLLHYRRRRVVQSEMERARLKSHFKRQLKLGLRKEHFDRYVANYFLGKNPAFSFRDIKAATKKTLRSLGRIVPDNL